MNNQDPQIPENYEIFFSPINRCYSIWYAKKGDLKAEMMAEGFKTKEDALEYLLMP